MGVPDVEKTKTLGYYQSMIYCYRDAKKYLNNIDNFHIDEIKKFIDRFNSSLGSYSLNGSSSFLLNCMDLSHKLSKSISYENGGTFIIWLKARTLFLAGHFDVAHKSLLNVGGIDKEPTEVFKYREFLDSIYNHTRDEVLIN